jgi:hypothetical protein
VIKGNLKQVKICYKRGLNQDHSLEGKITVKWTVGTGGHVLGTKIEGSSLSSKKVEGCLVERLKTWIFPEPPAKETVDIICSFEMSPKL